MSLTVLASCNQINNKVVYVHVRVAGQEFWVPRQYFLRVFPRSFDERSIGIHLIYPEFEPLSPNAGKVRKRERWFDRVSILVIEKAEKETPERKLQWTKDFFRITEKMDDKYGLTYLAPLPLTGEEELYVLKNTPNISFIRCSRDNSVPNPQCKVEYWDGPLNIEIGFDKDYLPDWKNIMDRSLDLINSFKQNPTMKEEK